jgi:hypothetical protein
MTMQMNFSDLQIHDSAVQSIFVDWETKSCVIKIDTAAGLMILHFFEVSKVTVPIEAPWGDSLCINSTNGFCAGEFKIEMQSGDVISIVAIRFTFESEII